MDDNKRIVIEGGKTRQSNIEALRLLSMLMVLNLHSFWGYEHGSGVMQALDFFRESTSICAVNVFLLISGYFGIKWKLKSFYNLIFQVFFYSFGVYVIASCLGAIEFSLGGLLSNVKALYASWGFITGYVLLYICAPLLNSFVDKGDCRHLLICIFVIFIAENFVCRDSSYLNYGLLYLIGRFLNKSKAVDRLEIKAGRYYWITTLLMFIIVYVLFRFLHVTNAVAMQGLFVGYSYAAPLVIFQAIFLFLVFGRMHFCNKFINWCASSCLAIFLIHMHPAIKEIGYYAITESFYHLPIWQHCIYLILLITGVFFGSILIDKIRIVISDFVYLIIEKLVSLLPTKILSVDTYIPSRLKRIL